MVRRAALAAVLAVTAVCVLAGSELADHNWDPTRFLRVGEVSSAHDFVVADIPDTRVVPGWGHDGQANYVLAATFPNVSRADDHLDSTTYRARRIVYPALVSWLPPGRSLAVGLIAVNLAAVAAAAAAFAILAARNGAPALVGAVVGITPAFLASVVVDLGDGLALALAAAGAVAWGERGSARSRPALAVLAWSLAGLARETALVVPLAHLVVSSRRCPARTDRRVLLIPPAVVVAWIAVLEVWIGGPGKSTAQFGLPFRGWIDAGVTSPETLAAASLVALSVWVARRLWEIAPAWAIVVALEAAVLCVVDDGVLLHVVNVARVAPWVVPWAAVILTRSSSEPERRLAEPVASDRAASSSGRAGDF